MEAERGLPSVLHTEQEFAIELSGSKVRGRIESIFAEAIVARHKQKDPRAETIQIQNPAKWDNNFASVASLRRKNKSTAKHLFVSHTATFLHL